MHESRLLLGIAALFAGMTMLLTMLGIVYSPLLLIVAALFGGVTYLFWSQGTGRLAARLYQRVERQAARNAGGGEQRRRRRASDGSGFGAGPREEWRGPRAEQRQRRQRARNQRRRRPASNDRPSVTEAAETLGVAPSADESTIKSAYREKVKEAHPDTEDGNEEQFKKVNSAYERLTDE